ncbi:MAG: PASTA domain-containing protein, partial [Thermodesulfovibrionales bacterium]
MKGAFRYALLAFLFLALVMSAAYVTFYLITSTESYEVPALTGKSMLEANRLLGDRKLFLKIVGEAHDAEIPTSHILRQDIPAGRQIKAGRTIGVIVSKGPKMLFVPMLSGLTLDEAEELVQQNNIKLDRVIKVHSATAEEGKVIAQDPNPEERGAGGMTLVVSAGNYEDILICPSFVDMTVEQAMAYARRLGLEPISSGESRKVGSQSPPP